MLVSRAVKRSTHLTSFSRRLISMGAEGNYTYRWPRPGLTVDTCVIAPAQDSVGDPSVLLIQRKHEPYTGAWALPGGFVDELEDLPTAAARELQEETSVDPTTVPLQQVGAFGEPGRDPRGWTVTVAYVAVVPTQDLGVKAADDAAAAQWFPVTELPPLAFDHKLVVRECFSKACGIPEASSMQTALQRGVGLLAGDWKACPSDS